MQAPNTIIAQTKSETGSGKTGFHSFIAIGFSQLISSLGAALMGFGISVWVFQTTNSVTSLSWLAVCSMLPRALSSIFAGVVVDRHGPRRAMMIGNVGELLSVLPVFVLLYNGQLQFWHICVTMALMSVCQSLLWPAVSSAIPALLGKEDFVRANGMLQAGNAVSGILIPLLGGVLALHYGLGAVLAITIGIYLISIPPLFMVHIPRTPITSEDGQPNSYMSSIGDAWIYFRQHRTLLRLMLIFAFSSFLIVIATVLLKPLILSFASAAALGTVLSIGALGMLLGALTVTAFGKGATNFKQVMFLMVVAGVCMALGGIRPVVWLISVATFLYSFTMPIISSGVQTIIQTSAPVNLQGRIHATLTAVTQGSMPLAFLIAGPLADYVFEPMLVDGGSLASSFGWILGVGPGRGMGLLLVILGSLIAGLSLLGQLNRQEQPLTINTLVVNEQE
jgi:MFS transporter, DHA3 family, macrolide efflux protein